MNDKELTNQEIKRRFTDNNIIACVTTLMDFVLKVSVDSFQNAPFTFEDIENFYKTLYWCDECSNYMEESEYGCLTDGDECPLCGEFSIIAEEGASEIFEWWIVSPFLFQELRLEKECVIDTYFNHYWGRCCTGQALFLDSVIHSICNRNGYLVGQENEWLIR